MHVRLTALITAGLVAACSTPTKLVVQDCRGIEHSPLQVQDDAVNVIIFTSHECPIANSYAPTLRKLHAEWATEPRVHLFLVHVDPDLSAAAADAHRRDYELPGATLLDPRHLLANACGATITPEAVVVTKDGIAYRGRIDDQWRKLGSRAPEASQHDLATAVGSVLNARPVAQPFPKAVGCMLPEPATSSP